MAELLQPTSSQIRDIIGLPETLLKLGPVHSIIETSSVLDLGPTADKMLSLDDTLDKIFLRKETDILGNFFQFTERTTPANPPANQTRFYAKDVGGLTKPMWLDSAGTETDLTAGGGGGEANLIASLGGGTVLTAAVPKSGVTLQTVSIATTAPITHSVAADLLTFDINDLVNADISATAAIVLTKLQNIATDRLLGRETAASGAIEEISLNATLELVTATTLQRAALTGDITASAGSNTTAIAAGVIVNADINASAGIVTTKLADSTNFVLTNRANTFGAFAQRFPTTQLQLDNPAGTFQYIFATSAIITADKTVTLPLLTANDTFVFNTFAATLANKTLTTPTIASFVNATHSHLNAAGGGTITKASISDTPWAKADIPSVTVYEDEANTWGEFRQTFNPNATIAGLNVGAHTADPSTPINADVFYNSTTNKFRFREGGAWVELGGGTSLPVVDTTSIAEGSVDATKEVRFEVDGLTTATVRVLTVPDKNISLVGTEDKLDAFSATTKAELETVISDVADFAEADGDTYSGAHLFNAATMRIPLSATPTMAVDGDFAIDTLITDFSMGLIKYFDGEEMAVISVPIAQLTTPTDGHVVTYDAAADEFQLKAGGGGSQTPWTSDIDADGFDLNDLSNIEFRTTTLAPGPTVQAIYADAGGIILNVPTADQFEFSVNDVDVVQLKEGQIDFLGSFFTIRYAGSANREFFNNASGFEFKVETGDSFIYKIQGAAKFGVDSLSVIIFGNDITEVGGTTDASAGGIKIANNIAINWRNAANSADFGITGNASDNIVFDTNLDISTKDIITDTTTGTKFGTATGQKIAFYNSTPVIQQTGVAVTAAGIHAALVTLGLITA